MCTYRDSRFLHFVQNLRKTSEIPMPGNRRKTSEIPMPGNRRSRKAPDAMVDPSFSKDALSRFPQAISAPFFITISLYRSCYLRKSRRSRYHFTKRERRLAAARAIESAKNQLSRTKIHVFNANNRPKNQLSRTKIHDFR